MGTTISIKSTTWLDRLPTEIIFLIFDYLSNNDIIYTFFFFSQRFNNLLLQNKRYFNYLELPTTNLDTWKNILSVIRSRIESLNINSIDLLLPLTYFSNLKSIILSSSYGYPDEQLRSIFESHYFRNLNLFKLKENSCTFNPFYTNYFSSQYCVFNNVFNQKNSLKTFEYSLIISSFSKIDMNICKTNFNINSLTLVLTDFQDIFTLISYTPNLEYLKVQSKPPYLFQKPINKTNIKLKQLCLKLSDDKFLPPPVSFAYNQLINAIKQFSSSLISLSLNLFDIDLIDTNEIPFNGTKLQQFLELMIELKQFHLYAKLHQYEYYHNILSKFQDQYWFDHNWIFAMHGRYFYTVPFHFNYLYEFYGDFNDVKSNNPEIFINNPRIWYNVKSIDLRHPSTYDDSFLQQLKIKMPKLNYIKFRPLLNDNEENTIEDLYVDKDKREKYPVILENVTTIECIRKYFEDEKEWLINALPHLNHLILSSADLPSADSRLGEILNKRIERLDLNAINSPLKQLTEISYAYFSNVHFIYFKLLYSPFENSEKYADILMKILKNFKSLQTLIVHSCQQSTNHIKSITKDLSKLLEHSNMHNYQMKQYHDWILFLKQECNDDKVQSGIFSLILRKV